MVLSKVVGLGFMGSRGWCYLEVGWGSRLGFMGSRGGCGLGMEGI